MNKSKSKVKRVPGRDTLNDMYKAIAKYIQEAGGTAIVLGGVSITARGERKFNYTICIDVTGVPPLPTKSKKN